MTLSRKTKGAVRQMNKRKAKRNENIVLERKEYLKQLKQRKCESISQRKKYMKQLMRKIRSEENSVQRDARLLKQRKYEQEKKAKSGEKRKNETVDKRLARLKKQRDYIKQKRANETAEERQNRLENMRQYIRTKRTNLQKNRVSSQAFKKMNPGEIPSELLNLSEMEKQLLARMIPFLKLGKFDGLHGQCSFEGQAVLFAQEQLPLELPQSLTDSQENINVLNLEKLKLALLWLANDKDRNSKINLREHGFNITDVGHIRQSLTRVQSETVSDVSDEEHGFNIKDVCHIQQNLAQVKLEAASDVSEEEHGFNITDACHIQQNLAQVKSEAVSDESNEEHGFNISNVCHIQQSFTLVKSEAASDVIDEEHGFNIGDVCQIKQNLMQVNSEAPIDVSEEGTSNNETNHWKRIKENKYILHGSFNQNFHLFGKTAGLQCMAMAATALIMTEISSPDLWTTSTINKILFQGNRLYSDSINRRIQPDEAEADTDYLAVEELLPNFSLFEHNIELNVSSFEECFHGNVLKTFSKQFQELENGIISFFHNKDKGILTCNKKSYALFKNGENYYYFDSHALGKKGFCAMKENGKAAVLKFTNVNDLIKQVKRALFGHCSKKENLKNKQYSIVPLRIDIEPVQENNE